MFKFKNLSKVIGVTAMSAVMMASMAMPAAAATAYTPVHGTTATLEKYLVMDNSAEVPNATFNFTIAPGTAIPAVAGSTMEVLAGPAGATINSSVQFKPGDATAAEASKGDKTVAFKTAATNDEKFASKTLTVDLSHVEFPEPGVYRYIITEAESTQQGITDDDQLTRTLDVYVADNNGTLVPSYVVHTGTAAPAATNGTNGTSDVTTAGAKLTDKSTGFTNSYATQDLHFSKKVTGNQGSKDKFFKFNVKATSVQTGDKFTVDMSKATAAPAKTAATSYEAAAMLAANTTQIVSGQITGEQLIAGVDFYLSDGESIVIQGLPKDAKYTVTETAEDYKSAEGNDLVAAAGTEAVLYTAEDQEVIDGTKQVGDVKVPAVAAKTYNDATSGTIASADIYTGFTNTRDGIIPTGIIMSGAPFMGIVAIGVAGIATLTVVNRKKSQE